MNCEQAQLAFGVYLLGVIDPAERTPVDRHLAQCRDCRREFDRLAAVPPLLDALQVGDVERLRSVPQWGRSDAPPVDLAAPSADLLDRILATAIRRRRHRRRLAALAAAAMVIIVAGLSVIMIRAVPGPAPAQAVSWTAADSRSGVRGEARLTSQGWGTEITLQLSGVPVGTECIVNAVARDGRSQPIGTWRPDDYSGTADVSVATSFSLIELESLLITNRAGETLLRLQP